MEELPAPGQDLVRIGLMPHIEQQPVAGGVETVVKREDQFDRSQIGGEVAAVLADRGEDEFANLRGDSGQLVRGNAAKFFR